MFDDRLFGYASGIGVNTFSGFKSAYEIVIARSSSIAAPYFDTGGKLLTEVAGSLFLREEGRYIEPGHVGISNRKVYMK